MKKLYKRGTVHPTPPLILDQLSFLPATILTLAAALSLEDREVLAYLLSCSSSNYAGNNKNIIHKTTTTAINRSSSSSSSSCSGGGGDHPPCFTCCCFRCYMSYWARWDASPNRQLIHEIIDAFEEGLTTQGKKEKGKRQRRKAGGGGGSSRGSDEFIRPEMSLNKDEFGESDSVEETSTSAGGDRTGDGGGSGGEDGEGGIEVLEKGSVRRLVSFLGDKIWSVWN